MRELVIFSFDTDYQLNGQAELTMNGIGGTMKGATIRRAEGSYKGHEEQSWIVSSDVYNRILKRFSHLIRDQESVLRVPRDGKNKAYLEFKDGSVETLGFLRKVDHVLPGQDYTYDVEDDQFYVIKER